MWLIATAGSNPALSAKSRVREGGQLTALSAEIDFRIPQPFRTFSVGWFSLLALGAAFSAVEAALDGALATLVISVVAAGLLGAMAWRWNGVGVESTTGALTVRNFASTRTIPRERVAGFRLGRARFAYQGLAVSVLLTDGSSVVMAATQRYSGSPVNPGSALLKTRHDEQLARLRGWLDDARALDGG